MLTGKRSVNSILVPAILVVILLGALAPLTMVSNVDTNDSKMSLEPKPEVSNVVGSVESYDLYLDEPVAENGGDGSISTAEPEGTQQEESALGGIEFRSGEMISDLQIFGTGSQDTVRLTILIKFEGSEGSTADVTFALAAGDSDVDSQTVTLEDPCTGGLFGSSCTWTPNEVFFDVGSEGFTVPNGKQLKLRVDAQATCEGSGGIGQGGDCDVLVAFGDIDSSQSTSRLEIKANALSGSAVKVHSCHVDYGCGWLDEEKVEWSPNHRPEYREMHFSVDVRDAFGREDIQDVKLVMTTPNGASTEFDKTFSEDDLRLDNNGLVGNFTWTYDAGMAAGEYPLYLEISDVQGHNVVFNHEGVTLVEHDVFIDLPITQPDTILIAPGQTSSVEFLLEHTGSSASIIEVTMDLAHPGLPSTWSHPIWDQPEKYTLNGGGASIRPILSIDVPDGDLSSAPDRIEIEARAYADNNEGQRIEVAIKTLFLEVEEVGVFSAPRVSIFEDVEHQRQIADSTRPEAYDESLSHYVDESETGMFFIDVFNSGFDNDNFRIRVVELPDAWQYRLYDNETGFELEEEGIHSLTPEIGSHQIMIIRMEVYPPSDRESQDIGLISMTISSAGETDLETEIGFTVHRTFGVLVEVIADSDSGTLAHVGPVAPDASMWFSLRITDSSDNGGSQTTWKIIQPDNLPRNTDNNPKYANWDYSVSNGSNSDIVVVTLAQDEYVDLKLDVGLLSEVEAGNHTIYTRVIEEGVDANIARYFDLPVVIEVQKDVRAGRLEVTQKSENTRFSPQETKNIEFRIDNQNNVPLDVVITLDEPTDWDGLIRASSDQAGGPFIILHLPAYSNKDFSVEITSPSQLKNSEEVSFSLTMTPMDENSPYDGNYTQIKSFKFKTECSGVSCMFNEIINPEPSTLALIIVVILLGLYSFYNKAKLSGENKDFEIDIDWDEEFENDEDSLQEELQIEVEVDDDLELLDELENL
ncbi:MAG: hypothetical protein NZ736_04030 [Candidatus Poseidoniaceae archaeon]|nr:hypothetical protein [Candidatus Poseidoniaceae archaeon]